MGSNQMNYPSKLTIRELRLGIFSGMRPISANPEFLIFLKLEFSIDKKVKFQWLTIGILTQDF